MNDFDDLPPNAPPAEISQDAMNAFAALQARIAEDMDEEQGPWQKMSTLGRYWPMALALIFGLATFVMLPTGTMNLWFSLASGTALVAAMVCFASVFSATTKPALSERLGKAGLLVALAALLFELVAAFAVQDSTFSLEHTLKCSGLYLGLSLIPLGFLIYGLRRSGFPVRVFHALGLTASAMVIASATNWKKCTIDDTMHLALGHVLLPAILFPLAALLVWRLTRKKSKLS